LELAFRPTIHLISTARRFVADFYEQAIDDPDTLSRVAMVAHELLENAVKYSSDGQAHVRIEIKEEPDAGRLVRIETRNRLPPDRLRDLQERFAEMQSYADPFEYYRLAMRRSCTLTEGSGLGLARIRAEGEMNMACRFEADEVCIRATTKIPDREAS
jgi:hypothetical protein